jgi:hypothetical protein
MMFKRHSVTYATAALCAIALPAHATVYVSGVGSDSNPCTISQPCRQISHALTVVAAAGQILVSASGDFQPIVVSKAVSITAPPGIHAGIASSTANPVSISVAATDNVFISGLDLSSSGSTWTTVLVSGGWVTIDNCLVRDTLQGIFNLNLGPNTRLYIKNTIITTNSGEGVIAQGGQTLIEHSTLQTGAGSGTPVGLNVTTASAAVVIRDTVLDGNFLSDGISVNGTITVDHCLITNQGNGILGGLLGSVVTVSNSTFASNSFGVLSSGGPVLSFGNNTFIGNGKDGSFTGAVSFK